MTLKITTWANSDHTKKVVKTERELSTHFSIHTMTDDTNGVTIEEAQEYVNKHKLQIIDTIKLSFQ